ncbi:tetratricopeptide repeat protein [Skeletonema marinoi]|uniref:Tetratricopeptide repeat protein n=1 Tax=Skeletonema marinoi TaxID=267567 RepID=A0AAD8YEJ7_9STRA|nr:tetratricopeptide repeat protein [Skeletonema marinoi]
MNPHGIDTPVQRKQSSDYRPIGLGNEHLLTDTITAILPIRSEARPQLREKKYEEALEKAKEAVKKEQLMRKRDKSRGELMFSTLFNLASAYDANSMHDKALKTYSICLTKQRGHPFAGRLRISMGNIYYAQHDYPSAIKCYEMALDQLSKDDQAIRSKLRWNIGNAFFRSGRLREAVKNYQDVMDSNSNPDYQTGFNLFLCHYALGDEDAMKQILKNLAAIRADDSAEDDSVDQVLSTQIEEGADHQAFIHLSTHDQLLLTAARLLASSLDETDVTASHDWVCSVLEDNHEHVVTHLELEQAINKLKGREFGIATEMFKELQKKSKALALTNLSCLSFLGGDGQKASDYADNAIEADRYSATALVNKANCFFLDGDFATAKDMYLEAIEIEADCFEAIYCLGLSLLSQGDAEHALQAFEKLHKLTPNNPEVIYQIADIYDLQGRYMDAIKWFSVLTARIPNDSNTLSRLGQLYLNANEDPQEAMHYKLESFRNFPLDLDVIGWIGSEFVKDELYGKSIYFFQQAALIQPNEVKWGLMIASALRRVEEYESALREYERLQQSFPDNGECKRNILTLRQMLGKVDRS